MSGARPADILRHLAGSDAEAHDPELLRRYASTRDSAAFAELVRRHGPVVLAACRRGTIRREDAEDSFQAVFLILARRAGSVGQPELLGNWLYRVAVRVARDARRAAARRRVREVQGVDVPEPAAPPTTTLHDLGPVLDEELAALPTHYRDAVVLCDLRGVSRADAAAQLGVPLGTLASRLDGGRKKLAAQLVRRGVTLSVTAVMVEGRAVAVPDALLQRTFEVVGTWSAGGALPQSVLKLAQGGLVVRRTMFLGLVAAVATTVVGVGLAARPEPPRPAALPAPPAVADEKADPVPVPAAAQGYAFASRPNRAVDLPLKDARQAMWSPEGGWLAVVGPETVEKPERKLMPVALVEPVFAKGEAAVTIELALAGSLVGFVPGPTGPAVVTDLREFKLLSGLHQLAFWALGDDLKQGAAGPRFPSRYYNPRRTVDIDPVPTHGYALAADGKTYRTVHATPRDKTMHIEVKEVSTESGRTLKTYPGVSGWRGELAADGRTLFVWEDAGAAAGYEVESGRKVWTHPFAPELGYRRFGVSAAGEVLVVEHSGYRVSVIDGKTGRALPALEGIDKADIPRVGPQNFSAGGRLVALCHTPMREVASGTWSDARPGTGVSVWDTRTGKRVKSWQGSAVVAFHPTRPVLALLEGNGEHIRLGLWDYATQP
jgi:RNA polymerase sigma factor (sigma-70 family)